MDATRRAFLTASAGVGAAWLIHDWASVDEALAHAAAAVAQTPPAAFTTLTADEAAQLSAMVERIMPTTDTPGAKEAGVIYFIDKALGMWEKEALPVARAGLADLKLRVGKRSKGATSFALLPPADQDAVLQEIEAGDFFKGIRFVTMVGMFAEPSYGGNRNQIGWKLLGFYHRPTYSPPFGYYDAEAAKGR